MIKGISGQSHIQVFDNQHTNLYVDMSRSLAGTVRYNGNNRELEVFDGYNWLAITNNYATISLDQISVEAINWAILKMNEEKNRTILATTHPAVAVALENLKRAEEQLVTTIHLSTNHEKTTS